MHLKAEGAGSVQAVRSEVGCTGEGGFKGKWGAGEREEENQT